MVYKIDGSLLDGLRVVEEIGTEMGIFPELLSLDGKNIRYDRLDAWAVVSNRMTTEEYLTKHAL
jgi:hypothetical protein|nr:MAG TPA: hypothetical protein [Caudoviricetes sp.]